MSFDNSGDTARIFYLVLLLIFIGSGVFYHYRNAFGKAVRDAAAWVLIFAVTILVCLFALRPYLGAKATEEGRARPAGTR